MASPSNAITLLPPMFIDTGFNTGDAGITISNTFCEAVISADSRQYTNGPRFTATWLRVSSTNGFDSSSTTGISIIHSILSPAFQVLFTGTNEDEEREVATSVPFIFNLADLHQPGIRR